VNFTSTSTGTTAGTTYTWNYGDNSANGSGITSSHTYSSNGYYYATLYADNGNNCYDTVAYFINITSYPCTLNANFNFTQSSNGLVTFTSTSTGTNNSTTYTWYNNQTYFSAGNPTGNVFLNGTYTITLVATNAAQTPAVCSSTVSQVIVVTSSTCNLNASFTSTQGANGLFNFSSTTTGTTANTVWYWNFGDGNNITGGPNQTHTYTNAGIYPVSMTAYESNAQCTDSVVNYINVTTVPCVANSNFTLTQNFPLNWTATPAYPWNAAWAIWSWGDNTSTFAPQVTTSHTYSQTAMYTICLTISVSCGGTSSTCATYSINRTSSPLAMAYVNVVLPTSTNLSTGIKQQTLVSKNDLIVYPNPSNGKFELSLMGLNEEQAKIKVYDITGALIYEAKGSIESGNLNHTIRLDKPQGIYFVKIEASSGVITKKIILKD
jgi:PKD repeat protein